MFDSQPKPFSSQCISSLLPSSDPHEALVNVRRVAASSLPPKKAHCANTKNALELSTFRPHVPTNCHVLLWTAPHSIASHDTMHAVGILLTLQRRVSEVLLQVQVPETRKSYGTGLLRFHQFCDHKHVPKSSRLPADRSSSLPSSPTPSVPASIIMKLGSWTSLCFLIYWRRLERIRCGMHTCNRSRVRTTIL
ncbi:hypothetical protein C8J57DRAFT_1516016 [Mycena rebaudengoi]|nr:hypothetical protein C8J57DRAFT_1516016 [Mycena rebaudengoi]